MPPRRQHMSRGEFAWRLVVIATLIACAALLALPGCGTVTPERIESTQASFDGGAQNSGILKLTEAGAVVTPGFRARYNALAETYGERFTPTLQPDAGLRAAPGREHGFPEYERLWVIDNEHLVKFLQMNAWRKMGRAS